MRLIYEPSVYRVVLATFDEGEVKRFLDDQKVTNWSLRIGDQSGGDGQFVPEMAGRLCYDFAKPRPGGNKAYLNHIKEVGHGSVLEHVNWSFIITGVSRSLSHELVRHRAGWGFSQLSQRYVDSKDVAFVVPVELQDEVRAAVSFIEKCKALPSVKHSGAGKTFADNLQWALDVAGNHPADCFADYEEERFTETGLLWLRGRVRDLEEYQQHADYLFKKIDRSEYEESAGRVAGSMNFPHGTKYENWTPSTELKTEMRKRARQTARSVLPNATETKLFVTANGRAWRHFIEQRGSKHAESEIRMLAYEIYRVLEREAPNLFGDYKWTFMHDKDVAQLRAEAESSGKPAASFGRPADVYTATRKV